MRTRIIGVFLLLATCGLGSKPSHALPAEKPLPSVFVSALAKVKTRTNISVLLPSELPKPFSNAEHAMVDDVKGDQYGVLLYYELGLGDAGFAASFSAKKNPSYSPRELANVQTVKLARGIVGFFRPVSLRRIVRPCKPLVGRRCGALSDSAGASFYTSRQGPAKYHDEGCQLGHPGGASLTVASDRRTSGLSIGDKPPFHQ